MSTRAILGYIDCPHCGHKGGMRITPDRNGAPFGYGEHCCAGQLRVGGAVRRVAAFYALYPHVKRDPAAAAPAPAPAPKPAAAAPAAAPKPAPRPVTAPVPAPAPVKRPSVGPFDFLMRAGDKA
jgi:hypothetical protein